MRRHIKAGIKKLRNMIFLKINNPSQYEKSELFGHFCIGDQVLMSDWTTLVNYYLNFIEIMSALQKIRETFQRMGYHPDALIAQTTFYALLDELCGGQFDRAVSQQLWEQATMGVNSEVRIEQISQVIADAQKILAQKIQETARDVQDLNAQKRRIQGAAMNQRDKQTELRRLDYELNEARKDLLEYQQDSRCVTIPFQGIANLSHYSQNSSYINHQQPNRLTNTFMGGVAGAPLVASNYPMGASQFPIHNPSGFPLNNQSQYHNQSQYSNQIAQKPQYFDNSMVSTASINQDLKIVLWIAIAMGLLEIIIMYKKYDFLNMLIIVTLLSIFLLDYFDSTYIKVCVGLVVFSIIMDIVWLCMYASTFWSPPIVSQHSQGQVVYLRFIVLFTLIILILKMPLVVLLLKYRDVPANTNFTVPVYGKTQLNVVSNRGNNLISQGCGHIPYI